MAIDHPSLITGVASCLRYLTLLGVRADAVKIRKVLERNPEAAIVTVAETNNKYSWDPPHLDVLVREITGFDLDLWMKQKERDAKRAKGLTPKTGKKRGAKPKKEAPQAERLVTWARVENGVERACAGEPGYEVAWGAWRPFNDDDYISTDPDALLVPYAMRGGALLPIVWNGVAYVLGRPGDLLTEGVFHAQEDWAETRVRVETSWPDVIWRVWTDPVRKATAEPPGAPASR